MIIYFSDTAEFCCEQAAIAQSVVRNIGSVEVTGSIPVSSFFSCKSKGEDASSPFCVRLVRRFFSTPSPVLRCSARAGHLVPAQAAHLRPDIL